MKRKKHLIIGSGPAALSAAETIRSLRPDDEIKMITSEKTLPYSPAALPYLLAGRLKAAGMWIRDEDYFRQNRLTFDRGLKVVEVLPRKKSVRFKGGRIESYDRLLIASGAEPAVPQVWGLKDVDFLGFRTMADYRRLKRKLTGKRKVVISGGGLVAAELAAAFIEAGFEPTVIVRSRLLRKYFDPESGSMIKALMQGAGVKVIEAATIEAVRKTKNGIKLFPDRGGPVSSEVLLTCLGVRPRIEFLAGSGIDLSAGVLVGQFLSTNYKDVFAAGDVAQAPEALSGRKGTNPILPGAIEQGRVAGTNMAGREIEYQGWVPANLFHFFGNTAFSAGLANPAESGFEVSVAWRKNQYQKLVFKDSKLVGAAFINTPAHPGQFMRLIKDRIEVGARKEALIKNPGLTASWLIREHERQSG